MGYCVMCHSVDYIQMNSVFMNRQVWDAEVTKMIKAYGAQVPPDQIPVILDYLTEELRRGNARAQVAPVAATAPPRAVVARSGISA